MGLFLLSTENSQIRWPGLQVALERYEDAVLDDAYIHRQHGIEFDTIKQDNQMVIAEQLQFKDEDTEQDFPVAP
ncbi:hypothetical protein PTKIN_Ptkin15bG0055300 [Pterospermum kingtungense]